MESERELVRRTLDFQKRGKEFALGEIPGYQSWSEQKLREGVSPAFIAHLDATSIFLLPEEVGSVDKDIFEELLEDISSKCGGY